MIPFNPSPIPILSFSLRAHNDDRAESWIHVHFDARMCARRRLERNARTVSDACSPGGAPATQTGSKDSYNSIAPRSSHRPTGIIPADEGDEEMTNQAQPLELTARPDSNPDSGLIDFRMLGAAAPLGRAPLLAPRTPSRRSPSLGGLALAIAVVASFASTAMASRALYLVRHGVATTATTPALVLATPETHEVRPASPATPTHREDVTSAIERGAAPSSPEALAPPAPTTSSTSAARAPRASSRATSSATTRSRTAASPASTPTAATTSSTSSLDELMERVSTQAAPTAGTTAPSAPARPEVPNRADVSRALGSLASRVDACGDAGTAMVRFTFDGPSGTARAATVTGELAGSTTARCVESAVASVTLPPFERSPFVVTFPYRL
jgi:hypothetical protein